MSELGGLGARVGPAASFDWVPDSPVVKLLPWMALCLLFLLKSNRPGQTWWIWAPTALSLAIEFGLGLILAELPGASSVGVDVFLQTAQIMTCAVAGWWLLGRAITGRLWILSFLGSVLAVAAFWGIGVACGPGISEHGIILIFSGISSGFGLLAVHAAGLLCRRQFSGPRFAAWLALSSLVIPGLLLSPVAVFMFFIGNGAPWLAFVLGLLCLGGFVFAVLLPFVGLFLANTFYCERLKNLLLLKPAPPPVPSAPPPLPEPAKGSA